MIRNVKTWNIGERHIKGSRNPADFNGVNLMTGGGALTIVRDITGNTTSVNATDLRSGGSGLTTSGLSGSTGASTCSPRCGPEARA